MVGTVAYTSLLPQLTPYVPKCPRPLATLAIQDAIINFCEKAKIVKAVLPLFDMIANQAAYDLSGQLKINGVLTNIMPANRALVEPWKVTLNGVKVENKSQDQLDKEWDELIKPVVYQYVTQNVWNDLSGENWISAVSDNPPFYYMLSPYVINFVGIPTTTWPADGTYPDGVEVIAVTKPLRTATDIEADVMEKYYIAFRDGALARLMATPKQPYSDPEGAATYAASYELALDNARRASLNDYTRDSQGTLRTKSFS